MKLLVQLAQFAPEDLQAWLNVELGMGFTVGGVILVVLASSFGLPLLHGPTRHKAMEMTGLKKKPQPNQPTNDESKGK